MTRKRVLFIEQRIEGPSYTIIIYSHNQRRTHFMAGIANNRQDKDMQANYQFAGTSYAWLVLGKKMPKCLFQLRHMRYITDLQKKKKKLECIQIRFDPFIESRFCTSRSSETQVQGFSVKLSKPGRSSSLILLSCLQHACLPTYRACQILIRSGLNFEVSCRKDTVILACQGRTRPNCSCGP